MILPLFHIYYLKKNHNQINDVLNKNELKKKIEIIKAELSQYYIEGENNIRNITD